jgi:hypothetical protein
VTEPDQKSRWKAWLILFLVGIVLGSSSCAGFISVAMSDHVIFAGILAGGFFAGVAATLVGAIVLVIRLVQSVSSSKSGDAS